MQQELPDGGRSRKIRHRLNMGPGGAVRVERRHKAKGRGKELDQGPWVKDIER